MSSILDLMINEKKGYRTESYSGSGVRNLNDVIRYEISMGNTDIVTYIQEKYGILDEYILEESQIEELREKFENETDFLREYNDAFFEMVSENAGFITDDILSFAMNKLNTENEDSLNAIWLTDYHNAVNYYNNGSEEEIDCYPLKDNFIVISDLNTDGSLFVYLD